MGPDLKPTESGVKQRTIPTDCNTSSSIPGRSNQILRRIKITLHRDACTRPQNKKQLQATFPQNQTQNHQTLSPSNIKRKQIVTKKQQLATSKKQRRGRGVLWTHICVELADEAGEVAVFE
jgi:hypothetical protein